MQSLRAQKQKILLLAAAFVLAVLSSTLSHAEEDRSQKLDFEDELIEGLNKKPYDHLSQVGEKKKKNQIEHLYWKRTNFHPETSELVKELRYIQ